MVHSVIASSKKQTATRLISGILIGLSLMPIAALANDDNAPPSGRAGGSRGCGTTAQSTSEGPSLILLAPQGRANQTVSTRPTFAWFARDGAIVSIEFRLYAQENNRYKLIKDIKDDSFKSRAGITVLSLAQSNPELAVGQYRWQVELICDRSHPSGNLFAESELEVVPMPPELKIQLEKTHDRATQVSVYAKANLWYNAMSLAMTLTDGLKASRLSLLDKIAINNTERQLLEGSSIYSVQR